MTNAAHFSPAAQIDQETVRTALRNLDQPLELARSPLATGATPAERAASVRSLLEDAAANAFGDSPAEQLLQSVVVRGYLDPQATHEQVASELYLSRATYFRKLAQASARMADYVQVCTATPAPALAPVIGIDSAPSRVAGNRPPCAARSVSSRRRFAQRGVRCSLRVAA